MREGNGPAAAGPASVSPATRTRRRRVVLTPRDHDLLRFVGRHGLATYDDLGAAIAAVNGAPVTRSAVRRLVARWEKRNLAVGAKLLTDVPPVVWLTAPGHRLVGTPAKKGRSQEPALATLRHDLAIAALGRRFTFDTPKPWVTWRELQASSDEFSDGVPDGIVGEGADAVVIEVELTRKADSRLHGILTDRLTAHAGRLLYIVGEPAIGTQVQTVASRFFDPSTAARILVRPAADVVPIAPRLAR